MYNVQHMKMYSYTYCTVKTYSYTYSGTLLNRHPSKADTRYRCKYWLHTEEVLVPMNY